MYVWCSFEFLYKQAVTSTDAFLGMMDKDASSACCEDLELRIDLPDAKGLSGMLSLSLTSKELAFCSAAAEELLPAVLPAIACIGIT